MCPNGRRWSVPRFSCVFQSWYHPWIKNIVVIEWVDDAIQPVLRKENKIPEEAITFARQIPPLAEDSWIEFIKLFTPDKMVD